ncbi:Striatin-interacting protein 2 [Trichinella murrelli]|uniref:Striatin-interacting protein 2 n=1 Tax=Trichinella murrelli TaxID=144512 RepID=A0A0V0TDU8_9BILA|nr:Striatin-interacting protein 2 [Trichinella murrelli]
MNSRRSNFLLYLAMVCCELRMELVVQKRKENIFLIEKHLIDFDPDKELIDLSHGDTAVVSCQSLMKLDMALNEVNIVKLNKSTSDGGGGGGIDVNKLQEIRQGLAARRAAQLPKLVSCLAKEITDSSSEQESSDTSEEASIDFQYGDCDSFLEELNELYSYSEAPDLCDNYSAFSERVASCCCSTNSWKLFDRKQMEHFIFSLLQEFEIVSQERRLAALKCLAYLLQGAFMECKSADELSEMVICNVVVAVECGVWPALCMLFHMEADSSLVITDADNRTPKDGQSLRLVLICMYTIVETVRRLDGEVDKLLLRQRFVQELSEQRADTSLVSVLLDMILKYCSGSAPYYPIRKLLLLLWKVLLLTLGGWKELREMKVQKRLAHGLHCGWEDTVSTACTMQPLPAGTTLAKGTGDVEPAVPVPTGRLRPPPPRRQLANCAAEFDDSSYCQTETSLGEETVTADEVEAADMLAAATGKPPDSPRAEQEAGAGARRCRVSAAGGERRLPWSTKIRRVDVLAFLQMERRKFFGYTLAEDEVSTAGLPLPIRESIAALRRHQYTSLAEVQIAREKLLQKYRFSQREVIDDVGSAAVEQLYRAVVPNVQQLAIGLVKVLFASAPSSKGKSDAVNLVHEVISVQTDHKCSNNDPSSSSPADIVDTPEALRLNLDVNRQKEIIVKATAALLLLMLKHFKLNHVYQFELLAQQLVFANCIPLIVKFFDQNVLAYVQSSNELPQLNYCQCALAFSSVGLRLPARFHQTLLETAATDSRQTSGPHPPANHFLWRNLFTLINLLRLLNKLAKWKHGRTMMLVVYKSAPILKRALRVRHMLLQLYALKLLKAQTKYLGKQWRKSNMELMSAIYRNVRHRLNDDWAYGNEVQSKSWDFQTEESNLMIEIDNFNCRRYGNLFGALRKTPSMAAIADVVFEDLQPYDNDVMSVLRKPFVFSQRFKRNYQQWLEHEVFQLNIDWDQLLQ